jgi:hypothetical protein
MATFSQTLVARVRHPLDEIIGHGMEMGVFKRDHVNTCATAITGILNMFILAHVFAGAEIDRETPLTQVRYYISGLTS